MAFSNIKINKEYRVPRDNIVEQLYIPLLRETVTYKRSVGFFTSSALLEIATGLSSLVKNGGKMLLIVSPYLDEADVEAINKGYELRDNIIERAMLKYLEEPENYFEEEKLNLLATLIAQEKLDIKIAFSYKNNKLGLYHEKMGIFCDSENNKVAFSGSMNESKTAFVENYETIDVYTSWTSEDSAERVRYKEIAFEKLWNNTDEMAKVEEFPKVVKEKLLQYKKDKLDLKFLEDIETRKIEDEEIVEKNIPMLPKNVHLYPYQQKAIEEWENNGYRGIFNMATGTGKTYTGLGAISKLYESKKEKLAVIIVCPQKHLVNQWVEDIYKFNIQPIIGHSSSKQNFRKRLKSAVIEYNLDISKFFCFVCTNDTYRKKDIQDEISKIEGNILLMVDEAHNIGAKSYLKTLDDRYKYRLALSATLNRHNDEEGTEFLKQFFGKSCINFTIDEAISQGYLTPYRYYPILVSLDDEELANYKELTNQIRKCLVKDKKGRYTYNERGKSLLIERSRIVAGAREKIGKLKEVMQDYKNDKYLLVYCGTASLEVEESNEENEKYIIEDKRQIDIITSMLSKELDMQVSQFTSKEDDTERQIIKEEYAEGKNLQALIAIKCLDEGVNIPQIKTAFILASTTNPKEYIQRRGRVLRIADNKPYAVIYDFVTLPRKLEAVWGLTEEELRGERTLVRNELNRIVEFKRIAMNPLDSDKIIEELREAYELWKNEEMEVEEEWKE